MNSEMCVDVAGIARQPHVRRLVRAKLFMHMFCFTHQITIVLWCSKSYGNVFRSWIVNFCLFMHIKRYWRPSVLAFALFQSRRFLLPEQALFSLVRGMGRF